ncbi:ATP-dependent helicase [Mesobacillus zeae]|uniref:DNA 3'-5' helicase n=1 Tax=Mesobacillus zeae TaxID=1917180 RepID=A0A398B255_9BACI|nr:ATP-dependent helicase [Mesobacillus zeae]RID82030.1 ATP-dependent DNA helicase Rep [Mesobacillus zeae]
MKTANYKNQYIKLDTFARQGWQRLYDDGKRGLLSCHQCGSPVRLYLGITEEPYFRHHAANGTNCSDADIIEADTISDIQEEGFIEHNGFRIPKSRTVGIKESPLAYKGAQSLIASRQFTPPLSVTPDTVNKYIQKLSNSGISFDRNQEEAVISDSGPLLILAGAGSGKTRVLTARTAYMLEEKQVSPDSLMLVTFTAKAAAEMKNRLTRYPEMDQGRVSRIVAGTFHSIFYRILTFHNRGMWSGERLLKKDWMREQILKEGGRELGFDDKEFAYDLALQQIGLWKNSMILPGKVKSETPWEEKAALLYKHYEDSKSRQSLFDFDDMLLGCHRLFTENPKLLEQYQNRFGHFLIDEFQDINKVQYELIKMLSAKTNNVCAVGDDDQSIYAFRGSDPSYLLQFREEFKGTKVVILDQNYRSPHEIVETANIIIKDNTARHKKEMKAGFQLGYSPVVFYPYDEEEEATMIVTDIQERIEKGASPGDFAILFRTNTGGRAIFERLASSSIPFRLDQDSESFYERFMVKGMLAYFRLSLDEDDTEALKNIMPSLFLKPSVYRDVQAESILKDCSILAALSQVKTGFAFQEQKLKKLAAVVKKLADMSPSAAIECVEKDLGFQDFIKKRGSEGNKMDKGSDDIRDLKVAARNFATLSDFLDHADHMKKMNSEIKKLSKAFQEAVTLSTIHRSKGLEYQTVYVIGAVEGSLPHDFALDSQRNGDPAPLEEERRLLYVAVTRAKERLFLSVPLNRRGRKANVSRFLSKLKKATV